MFYAAYDRGRFNSGAPLHVGLIMQLCCMAFQRDLGTTGPADNTVALTSLYTGDLASWSLDGNTMDLVAQADAYSLTDLTYAAGHVYRDVLAGQTQTLGQCAVFNGTTSVIRINSPVRGTGDFTRRFWINCPDKTATGNAMVIMVQSQASFVAGGWNVSIDNATGKLGFQDKDGTGLNFNISTSASVCDGAWHQIVVRRWSVSGTTYASIWVDGAAATADTVGRLVSYVNSVDNPSDDLKVGQWTGSGGNQYAFAGSLSNVDFVGRRWSDAEVVADNNAGNGTPFPLQHAIASTANYLIKFGGALLLDYEYEGVNSLAQYSAQVQRLIAEWRLLAPGMLIGNFDTGLGTGLDATPATCAALDVAIFQAYIGTVTALHDYAALDAFTRTKVAAIRAATNKRIIMTADPYDLDSNAPLNFSTVSSIVSLCRELDIDLCWWSYQSTGDYDPTLPAVRYVRQASSHRPLGG